MAHALHNEALFGTEAKTNHAAMNLCRQADFLNRVGIDIDMGALR